MVKKYDFGGVPVILDQGTCNSHSFFAGGFFSQLAIIDTRLAKLSFKKQFPSTDAICSLTESLYQQNCIILGDRTGKCLIYDLKKRKTTFEWEAHKGRSNALKPNGVIKIFEMDKHSYLTVGAVEKKIKSWEVKKTAKKPFWLFLTLILVEE